MIRKTFLFLFLCFILKPVLGSTGIFWKANILYGANLDQHLILQTFNTYRSQGAQCGRQFREPAPPFTWNDQLASVAQHYSDALHANRDNPDFIQKGGFDLAGALSETGYDFVHLHQSQARLTPAYTEALFVEWIMDNASACEHVMNADYAEMAVAKTDLFWVMLLATPNIPHYWNMDSININLLLEETNRFRTMGARCGNEYFPPVDPVVWNEQLEAAARLHSNDMHENQFFDHTGTGGSTLVSRIEQIGYRYRNIGENIAMGETQTETIVVEGWMNSPGHCRNIMNASFTEMGVARTGIHWTQEFGRPLQQ